MFIGTHCSRDKGQGKIVVETRDGQLSKTEYNVYKYDRYMQLLQNATYFYYTFKINVCR